MKYSAMNHKKNASVSPTLCGLLRRWRCTAFPATIFLMLAPLAGCGGSKPETTTVQTPTRFVNALVSVPTPLGVDLATPSALVQNKLPFGGVTRYANVDTGLQTFTANQSGTTNAVIQNTVTLDTSASRTIIAAGVSGSPDATLAPRLETLTDAKIPTNLGSSVAVRLAVYATGVDGPVDLFKDTTVVSGATNVTSGNPTQYAILAAGGGLSIHDTATDTDLKLPRLAKANLIAGRAYTILLIGQRAAGFPADGSGLEATVLPDN